MPPKTLKRKQVGKIGTRRASELALLLINYLLQMTNLNQKNLAVVHEVSIIIVEIILTIIILWLIFISLQIK